MPDDAPPGDKAPPGDGTPPPVAPQPEWPPPAWPPPAGPPPNWPPPAGPPPPWPPPSSTPPAYPPGEGPPPHGRGLPDGPPGPGWWAGAGPTDVTGRPLSSWGRRALAFLLDAVVVGLAGGVLSVAVTRPELRGTGGGATVIHWRSGGLFVFVALLYLAYTAYFTFLTGSRRGQTVGSLVMGTAVRDAGGQGQIGAARGLARAMVMSTFIVPYLFIPWVLDMLWPLWDPGRQSIHDKLARSVVVDVR
jgi:uncharacterized RDD family membrane protein YckC